MVTFTYVLCYATSAISNFLKPRFPTFLSHEAAICALVQKHFLSLEAVYVCVLVCVCELGALGCVGRVG